VGLAIQPRATWLNFSPVFRTCCHAKRQSLDDCAFVSSRVNAFAIGMNSSRVAFTYSKTL